MLEKTAICVEFCLELDHFSRKWLESILMVSQDVCPEFSQINNFKSLQQNLEKWGRDLFESLIFAVFAN